MVTSAPSRLVKRVSLWERLQALVDGRVVSAILTVGFDEVDGDMSLASDVVVMPVSELGDASDDDDALVVVARVEVAAATTDELLANAAAGLDCTRWVRYQYSIRDD